MFIQYISTSGTARHVLIHTFLRYECELPFSNQQMEPECYLKGQVNTASLLRTGIIYVV